MYWYTKATRPMMQKIAACKNNQCQQILNAMVAAALLFICNDWSMCSNVSLIIFQCITCFAHWLSICWVFTFHVLCKLWDCNAPKPLSPSNTKRQLQKQTVGIPTPPRLSKAKTIKNEINALLKTLREYIIASAPLFRGGQKVVAPSFT